MDFGANKTPVEVIKESAFGGTYLVDIYSGVNDKWYNKVTFTKLWKEFVSNYCDVTVKCRASLRFWKNERIIWITILYK